MAQTLFTARLGGISQGVYASLNLADHVGDSPAVVQSNREILSALISQKSAKFMNQVHGDQVVEVDGATDSPITADALITREPGLPLVVLAADCLPILISSKNIVAAIHAGRRGVLNGIITKAVDQMRILGADDMTATIGPAICGSCYEVSPEMYLDAVAQIPELATTIASRKLNLSAAAKSQLEHKGVGVQSIDICTAHNKNYFSYRRDGDTGRNAGVIVL
ncbi:MAG: peptidoglycan editing factor PgeF [Actinobacteria bacterium]|uniref:Unannotated protein n=1 Tax=freshwater metagenome TaxID=449393 RepID=A0A6J6C2U2_9ZZZZ|nr:peptidoglycan editing factor PgeF [Actinomycetota bacterium]